MRMSKVWTTYGDVSRVTTKHDLQSSRTRHQENDIKSHFPSGNEGRTLFSAEKHLPPVLRQCDIVWWGKIVPNRHLWDTPYNGTNGWKTYINLKGWVDSPSCFGCENTHNILKLYTNNNINHHMQIYLQTLKMTNMVNRRSIHRHVT